MAEDSELATRSKRQREFPAKTQLGGRYLWREVYFSHRLSLVDRLLVTSSLASPLHTMHDDRKYYFTMIMIMIMTDLGTCY